MGGHVDKLGRSLTSAVNDYNDTVGSLETKVLVTARKLNETPGDRRRPGRRSRARGDRATADQARARRVGGSERDRSSCFPPAIELDGRTADYGIDAGATDKPNRRTGS